VATLADVLMRLFPVPAVLAVLLPIAFLVGACGGGASKEDFTADVVAARNDADAGLKQVVQATSVKDLLERMRIAAVEVRGASTDVREADAPGDLEDERDALAEDLLALSDEIVATVETLEAFPDQAQATRALNFEQWNAVQASLAALRREGVDVPALGRHAPELQRQ
jgi:hypothetical protein